MNVRPEHELRRLAWAPRAALVVLLAALVVLALQQRLYHRERARLAAGSACARCSHLVPHTE